MPPAGSVERVASMPAGPLLTLVHGVLDRKDKLTFTEVDAKLGRSLQQSLGRPLTPDDVLAAETYVRSLQRVGRRVAVLDVSCAIPVRPPPHPNEVVACTTPCCTRHLALTLSLVRPPRLRRMLALT